MNIIFMGTPNFAVVSLQRILDDGHNIVAVFTQPDKCKGRGYKLESSPVKILAEKFELKIFQPDNVRDESIVNIIKNLNPDIIVVVAYGKIIPKQILEIPLNGCINVHGSLLPKYRGAAPIQWSIINGDKFTGVTTMFINEKLDCGDIICKEQVMIKPDETSGELMERLSYVGANILSKTLKDIGSGLVKREPQRECEMSLAPILSKNLANITFNSLSSDIFNLIRGINPWPVARVKFHGKFLKIYKSKIINGIKDEPGKIISDKRFIIACLDAGIELIEVQIEGGKRMNSLDFLKGHKISIGEFIEEVH